MVLFFGVLGFGQAESCESGARLEAIFKQKTVVNNKTLFVIDEHHLLEPTYDSKCALIQLRVGNKGMWINPDDDNAADHSVGLRSVQYKELMDRINKVLPIGEFRASDTVGVASPRGTTSWSRFQNALVQITSTQVDDNRFISQVSIYFLHEVTVKLTERILFDRRGFMKKAKVTIDGESYWADETAVAEKHIDGTGKFKVFGGPIL